MQVLLSYIFACKLHVCEMYLHVMHIFVYRLVHVHAYDHAYIVISNRLVTVNDSILLLRRLCKIDFV